MRNSIFIIILLLPVTMILYSCSQSAHKHPAGESKSVKEVVYTCTMHPEVRSDKQGDCPICGMELVVMEKDQPDTIHGN